MITVHLPVFSHAQYGVCNYSEGIVKRHKASQALWGENRTAAVAAGL